MGSGMPEKIFEVPTSMTAPR